MSIKPGSAWTLKMQIRKELPLEMQRRKAVEDYDCQVSPIPLLTGSEEEFSPVCVCCHSGPVAWFRISPNDSFGLLHLFSGSAEEIGEKTWEHVIPL
jgi:hypothetical protein